MTYTKQEVQRGLIQGQSPLVFIKMCDYVSTTVFIKYYRLTQNDLRSFTICQSTLSSPQLCLAWTPVSNQADRKVFNHGEKQNEQLQSILWWCFRRSNKCSISALIGSRNHSVTSAAESALPTEWWVIGQDRASKSGENMASITREDFCCWFHQSHGVMSKKRGVSHFKCQFLKFVPEIPPLFIATYKLFNWGWQQDG